MIKEVETGIFDDISSDDSVILQQVNCRGILQQGMPTRINRRFPGWYDDYRKYCLWFKDGHEDEIMGSFHRFDAAKNTIVCSAFCQLAPLKSNVQTTDLDAWHQICRKIEKQTNAVNKMTGKNWKIHVQSDVGCRDGNANPDDMREIFDLYFADSPVELIIHRY